MDASIVRVAKILSFVNNVLNLVVILVIVILRDMLKEMVGTVIVEMR